MSALQARVAELAAELTRERLERPEERARVAALTAELAGLARIMAETARNGQEERRPWWKRLPGRGTEPEPEEAS